jgi:hypothetical protein
MRIGYFSCGPAAEGHLRQLQQYADAGFDEVYVANVGPYQEGFFRLYADEVLPRLR